MNDVVKDLAVQVAGAVLTTAAIYLTTKVMETAFESGEDWEDI